MLYDQYVFKQSAEENVYVRKCYGFETITSNMQQACDGLTHLTISAAARFAPAPSRDTLKSQVHDAWITLRHQIPALACQNFRFPAPDNHFAFRYTVPRSSVDAYAWAKDTVVFHHHHPQSLYQKHCELRDKRWWPCLGGHHVAELHVSPSPIGWQFRCVSMLFSSETLN
ncbi:hypothetical protein PLICRDRAFT_117751 [Plicaturopsis crispa FD-325 SS-3]|uniref:Uncharacterized protein n=1 Tax=Plicaturopsis crispa FD-325 SS-3 TaxID=944288 RepID=A0A0C9SKY5_PLICR|nr:hypothetical protein PLICRDRAFT_117751 [Plicaturopsis crispa FD-325 SS-3]